jgi:glycosyltransferase involved in cell wall biosynthesis
MIKLPISVCMIARAEAGRIGRALESVAHWTNEIIVVLNDDVSDGTDRIAASHGAKVLREPWKGHIAQKNSAAAKATQPWLFGLDADEVVSPALRAEMERIFSDLDALHRFAAFSCPRLTLFCGRWIRHGDWYPDRQTRLWQRGRAQWQGIDPHDKLQVDGPVARLSSDLWHYTAESVDRQIAKINRYADDFARHRLAAGQPARQLELFVRPGWRFLRSYVLKLGFLDGWQGLYVAWFTAFYTMVRYARLREAGLRAEAPPSSVP